MPAIVRLGDMSSACCAPPRPSSSGYAKVLINGKPTHRIGDSWQPHACPKEPPHTATTTSGSSRTFVGGKGVARVGDSISCGSACVEGSPNTFAT